ncbi:MAG: cytochrome C oxidase subunit IV family protein [Deltaproteobacteria bacterium]|nr:cytochrome C oxidase subunit IV family protein [Deltaproteobacteria bacterium]
MLRTHVTGRAYLYTWIALSLLSLVTLLASLADFGAWDLTIALAIATAKGTLVVLFFMHMIEQRFVNRMVLILSTLFLLILVTLVVSDVATRAAVAQ